MITVIDSNVPRTIAAAQRRLRELMKTAPAHIFHVGMTVRAARRLRGPPYRYLTVAGTRHSGYIRVLHLIYSGDDYARCQQAERQLIDTARAIVGDYSASGIILGNQRAGGAGRRPQAGPYFVYLAFGG